ncbi:MAG: RluA family pseudouridine synthase [Ruthenibacterium sp.]
MQTILIAAPTRLDAAISNAFPALSGGRLYKYLRENKIKVNGKKLPLNARLVPDDKVFLYLPDHIVSSPEGPLFLQARREFTAVYEDDAILVADKPAGLPVADEIGATADTLLNRALLYLYDKGTWQPENAFTPCLCHRLDTGTSGLVLLAKSAAAEQCLCTMLQSREITKKYLCVTFGWPQPKSATLHGYLKKDAARGIVTIVSRADDSAKKIITCYHTLTTSGRLALLEVELVTGRTHQIRAHLASIGCPILGDSKYGDNAANRVYKMKYQALCAHSITFPDLIHAPCEALCGVTLTAKQPWYVQQILEGSLK